MDKNTQLDKMGLFDARVPRYTSYPTATRFGNAIHSDHHVKWLDSITSSASISLYMHFPFCRRLCWFCACRTQGVSSLSPVENYVDIVIHELNHIARRLPQGVALSQLHWGGGTPTLLSPQLMKRVSDAVFDTFGLDANFEFSVEIDPTELDQARCDTLKKIGMTRASIGVQDFDADIQRIIGREQSFEATQKAVDMLRQTGVNSLNADILFGLPDQTPARLTETVQKLLALSPSRIALYGYAHVPWMAKRQTLIPEDKLPTPVQRLKLFDTAANILEWDGYKAIGIDHFARPEDSMTKAAHSGRLHRNFQGYTTDTSDTLISLGASAISKFPQGFTQNEPSTSKYIKSVLENRFATYRGHEFSPEDKLRARMIEMLMCDFAINIGELVNDFDVSIADVKAILRPKMSRYGELVSLTDQAFTISKEARPLTRMIAREIDAYEVAPEGHSHAI